MFYLKLVFGTFWFLFCSLVTLIISIVRWRNPNNAYLFVRLFTPLVNKIIGLKVVINHPERLSQYQPCIFIGNHRSLFDILTHALCFPPRTVAIGKKELIWIPFFGILFLASGNILIDRKNQKKALRELHEAELDMNRKQVSIYMFPEGTRGRTEKKLLPFKKGAFYMAINGQVPIVPVVASSISPILNISEKKFRSGTVYIDVLEPIFTKGLTLANVDETVKMASERMQISLTNLETVLDK
jgi:1-acyl-sn-glycerol-3-phosphate acyltransferase